LIYSYSIGLSLKVNENVEPSPGTDENLILPSNLDAIYSEITKPSPIPLVFIYAVS